MALYPYAPDIRHILSAKANCDFDFYDTPFAFLLHFSLAVCFGTSP